MNEKKQNKLFFILLALFLMPLATEAKTKSEPKIDSIQAYLFYNQTRQIDSRNLIDNKEISLWNTIIGEGSAGGYSSDTYIVVSISFEPGKPAEQKIKIAVTEEGKPKTKAVADLGIFNTNGLYYIPFVVNDTGCGKLSITAEVIGGKSRLTKTIPFRCGE